MTMRESGAVGLYGAWRGGATAPRIGWWMGAPVDVVCIRLDLRWPGAQ
eukprot:CAMPEP_0182546176 /NCGR_PEP_ID=MMETSP1323-20130603/35626_1 /TAXON_ID=236787 /ORGANISM="Florenciella parvula, Strain RCC1693" /LENGTH=47 /DNA_ID= /DNA_START= /DNA_END= /DNA_ORIENTATION=